MVEKKTNKILMVGSSTKVKGGMTTVVESFLNYDFKDEFKIVYIPTHIENTNTFYKLLFFFISLLRIVYNLLFNRIRIVHMHMSERGSFKRKYIIYKIAKFFNKIVITHSHGAEFKEYYDVVNAKQKSKISELLRESDLVITLGERWSEIIKNIEPNSKTCILRNAVNIPAESNMIIEKDCYNILFLAVLIKRKGILDLINSSALIIDELKKFNKEVKFTIAGDGELLNESIDLVTQLGLKENFYFLGWVDNKKKAELLRKADLFILPSYNEGLPLSIIEAMSYGVPIISTNVGSINEAVICGRNGFLIKPGDTKGIKNAITKLLTKGDISQFSEESRVLAEERFDNNKYFDRIKLIYSNLLMGMKDS
ncbi:glycosyltransferase family 4 protein [Heyndrickxia ginsengihumi]|uniref:glycosyltransferase family 4 protein n=1 Tax=Heyndrickxia ginsengihumi TaxID=363870 RepID=UPI003D1EE600